MVILKLVLIAFLMLWCPINIIYIDTFGTLYSVVPSRGLICCFCSLYSLNEFDSLVQTTNILLNDCQARFIFCCRILLSRLLFQTKEINLDNQISIMKRSIEFRWATLVMIFRRNYAYRLEWLILALNALAESLLGCAA